MTSTHHIEPTTSRVVIEQITPAVDGRPMLNGWNDERKDFWGFDRDELPLQARVWYPDGDGPFPLVLIVHGNHSMYEYSDPGVKSKSSCRYSMRRICSKEITSVYVTPPSIIA